MNFFNPEGEIHKNGDALPHWQQGEVMQFITFRLNDSLPKSLLDMWLNERSEWLVCHPEPWSAEIRTEYHRKFSARIERWLDQGMGSCWFAASSARKILEACFMRFEGVRVRHQAWVIMPNHVHLLFAPLVPIAELIQAWKSHSARLLGRGPIWQRDYHDTLIRDADHCANVMRYIRRNPIKARLADRSFTLWEKTCGQDVRRTQPSE